MPRQILIKPPLIVGVTGGIGSGKSEVCSVFSSLGARCYFADQIAKELLDSDSIVRTSVEERFGSHLYRTDHTLDRKALAKIVFGDDGALRAIDEIVHPRVTERLRKIIQSETERREAPVIAIEAALIFEAHIEELFDYIVVVAARLEERISRTAKRDSATEADVRRRIGSQLPPEEVEKRGDFVIRNSGNREQLRESCEFIFSLLTQMGPPEKEAEE